MTEYKLLRSDQIDKVAPAIVRVQAEIGVAAFDATNPFHHSKYATLASHWEAARDILAANELALIQMPIGNGELFGIMNLLMHSSGQFIGSECTVRPAKAGPQELVSLSTYLRRVSMSGILALISGDDDDGNAAQMGKTKEMTEKEKEAFANEAGEMFAGGANGNQVYQSLRTKYPALTLPVVNSAWKFWQGGE